MEAVRRRGFRLTLSALMIVVAACALLLAPAIWMYRVLVHERQMALEARYFAAERAHAAARAQLELLNAQQLAAAAAQNAVPPRANSKPAQRGLWAALGVNHVVVRAGETEDLRFEFTLVNEGNEPIDPQVANSRILINGDALGDSASILRGVGGNGGANVLRPGNDLQFGGTLGKYFEKPGDYTVSWQGEAFRAPDVVIRVRPKSPP